VDCRLWTNKATNQKLWTVNCRLWTKKLRTTYSWLRTKKTMDSRPSTVD